MIQGIVLPDGGDGRWGQLLAPTSSVEIEPTHSHYAVVTRSKMPGTIEALLAAIQSVSSGIPNQKSDHSYCVIPLPDPQVMMEKDIRAKFAL